MGGQWEGRAAVEPASLPGLNSSPLVLKLTLDSWISKMSLPSPSHLGVSKKPSSQKLEWNSLCRGGSDCFLSVM